LVDQLAKNNGALHIVFGNATFGSLKMGLPVNEKVIGFPELFSTGPILDLHKDNGLATRYEWMENHLLFDNKDLRDDKIRLRNAFSAVASIPEHVSVVIWTGDNAHEQTGMRLALHLLKDKANEVYLINATDVYTALLSEADREYFLIHSGELAPEDLRFIYEHNYPNKPLSIEQRKQFEQDWEALAATREVLRVWKDGEIVSVPDDFYDDYIIDTARKLRDEHEGFIKSACVVGAVLGDLDQYVGDQYLEYRLRYLISKDIFEIEGVPKAMRFYSVKLR